MSLIGYARVSTQDQNTESQTDALTEAGCERIFVDKASGKLARRPELDKALEYLRRGDVLVITKLDRLGRSVRNLVELVDVLRERGIDLRVLHQGIDTTTPGGMLVFHIMGAIAEFERALLSERTKDGLASALARGRKGGRKHKLTPEQVAEARGWIDRGEKTVTAVAALFNVSRQTVYRALEGDSGSATASSAMTAPSKQRR